MTDGPVTDEQAARRAAAIAALRGVAAGVGQAAADRAAREQAAGDAGAAGSDRSTAKRAAAAVGGFVGGVGQNVSGLVRQEIGAARAEVLRSAKAAARGTGLLGGAAVAGHMAVLFTGVAAWRGMGNRIGYARSAVVVAAVSGATAAALASSGAAELRRLRGAPRPGDRPPAP